MVSHFIMISINGFSIANAKDPSDALSNVNPLGPWRAQFHEEFLPSIKSPRFMRISSINKIS